MSPALLSLAMKELPRVLDFARETFMKQNPGEPPPTNEQVIAAYRQAFTSSVAKDQAWLRAHPEAVPGTAPSGATRNPGPGAVVPPAQT